VKIKQTGSNRFFQSYVENYMAFDIQYN